MIGQYFIQAVFSNGFSAMGGEHWVEEFMPMELFTYLEEKAQEKFSKKLNLFEAYNEWDLDRFFITVGGAISEIDAEEDNDVTINFHVDRKGEISNITVNE
jgi:hypothetical protein